MPRASVSDDEYDLLTEDERIGLKEYQAEYEAERAAEDAAIAAAAAGDPEDGDAPETPDKPIKPEKPDKPTKKATPEEPDEPVEEPDDEPEDDEDDPIDTEEEAEESAEEEVEGQTGEIDVDEPPHQAGVADVIVPPVMLRLTDAEEKRLGAIKSQLKELAQKFDDGELTAVEWRDEQEKLEDERDALKEKRAIAAMTTQTSVNTWYQSTIPLFLAQHPEYKDGTLRHKLLDTIVRELQMATTTPTDPKILIAAHKRITEELGAVNGAEKPVPKKKANGKNRESPPKFADIPASDGEQITQPNKFARLDKLNGADYERALAKLTPADREFYLQGGA